MIGSIVGNTIAMAAAAVLSIAFPIAGSVMGAMLLPMAAVISPFLLFGS
ncbi:hypothetical protein [Nocardia brasiliensis]|nr:hypothetical protein [Nocardia brasiliensis]